MAIEGDPSVWDWLALVNMDALEVTDCAAALCDRCKKRCADDDAAAAGKKDPSFDWLAFRSMGMPNSDSILLAT